jgi:repressor LexA
MMAVATKKPLTPRQSEILEFLRDHIRTKGFAPTLDEIAAHFGLKAISGIQTSLVRLEEKGYIWRAFYRKRWIEILPDEKVVTITAQQAGQIIELLGEFQSELGVLVNSHFPPGDSDQKLVEKARKSWKSAEEAVKALEAARA